MAQSNGIVFDGAQHISEKQKSIQSERFCNLKAVADFSGRSSIPPIIDNNCI